MFRVTAETSPTLVEAIRDRSLAEFSGMEVMNDETMKGVRVGGETHDWTELLADSRTTRKHRRWTGGYREAGYRLRHDEKIARTACLWYFSRVVYSGPEEFCNQMLLQGIDDALYPGNVSNEIRACDEAIGYPRGE